MNNHYVPDFEIQMDEEEGDYPIPIPSTPKKLSVQNDDEIMELLWQNGQVVFQSQNQRQLRKPPPPERNTGAIAAEPSSAREAENFHNQNLFLQEDEMASWLHYTIDEETPLDHQEFCADMLDAPPPNHGGVTEIRPVAAPQPPIPTARRIQNFANFVKHGNARAETAALRSPASLKPAAAVRESTAVDSCETPAATTAAEAAAASRSSAEHGESDRWNASTAGKEASSGGGGETETATFEMTVTSSPGGSSGSAKPVQREPIVDRKRKGREAEDSEFQSEDVDFDSPEAKKQVRGSTSTKRSRAAEVHNLSERRRRDRINEKMKALQELIPRCNKTDKASMLDEAIEYLKSLQLQVQMMSMGCGILPMMLPGMQQYMPPPMGMGMNRPVMPFPNMLAKSALPAATATATATTHHHLGPRFPMPPPFHVNGPADPSKLQAANQSDNMLTSLGTPDVDNQSHIPNFTDPYQQYLGPFQMNLHLMQAMNQPNATKPSTSKDQENPEKHQQEQS